jgi:hypothetical protein
VTESAGKRPSNTTAKDIERNTTFVSFLFIAYNFLKRCPVNHSFPSE